MSLSSIVFSKFGSVLFLLRKLNFMFHDYCHILGPTRILVFTAMI